tara:strand:+ start:7062 stop:8156 length:1095 start_codon:yes stop_codon:yes gene_type:complete
MDTCKINFCNTSGFLISNKRDRSNILKRLFKKYDIDTGNNYEKSYSDNFVNIMKNREMISCFITRGKKYYLYLTTINNENITLLIDASVKNDIPKLICIPVSINSELYKDTLFLGEMLLYNNNWTFLIDNCKLYKGSLTYNKNVLDIVKLCNDFVKNKINNNELCPFDISVKQFFAINDIEYNLKHNRLPLIGIKFIGLKNPIVFYFNIQNYDNNHSLSGFLEDYSSKHIEKEIQKIEAEYDNMHNLKISNDNNKMFDDNIFNKEFIVKIRPNTNYGIYDIYSNDNKKGIVKTGISRISTIELNKSIIDHFKDNNECIVTCIYNPDFVKWEIIKIENDKQLSSYNDMKIHIDYFKNHKKAIYVD